MCNIKAKIKYTLYLKLLKNRSYKQIKTENPLNFPQLQFPLTKTVKLLKEI